MRTVSAEHFPRLLDALPDDGLRQLAYVAVQTGARLGELLALRWSDIDLDAGRLSIQRALEHFTSAQPASFRQPKTAKGRRSIALSPDTVPVLREHRAQQSAGRLHLGAAWNDHDLVFCDPLGLPAHKFQVSSRFIRIARAAGFDGLRFHDLRHTAATLMLGAGVHPKIVSERLGHSTIAITLDTYSHVLPEMQREAAAALDDVLRVANPAAKIS